MSPPLVKTRQLFPLTSPKTKVTNLLTQLWKGPAQVGEGRIIHNVPVKNVDLVHGHGFLWKRKRERETQILTTTGKLNATETRAATHQISQDDFNGHKMAGGVQQDSSVRKSGEVADDGCIDAFLRTEKQMCVTTSVNPFSQSGRSQFVSYCSVFIFVHQLTESFQT